MSKISNSISVLYALCLTSTYAAYLSPVLKNVHTKIDASQQRLLLLPFQEQIVEFYDLTRDKQYYEHHPLNDVKIDVSRIKVVSDDSINVNFDLSLTGSASSINRGKCNLDAIFDLESSSVAALSLESSSMAVGSNTLKSSFLQPEDTLLVSQDHILQDLFMKYIKENQGLSDLAKQLDGDKEEYLKRYFIFAKNVVVSKFLTLIERGTAEYGVTKFSDVTPKEFATFYKLPRNLISDHLENDKVWNIKHQKYENEEKDVPEDFDWRQKNAVTEVKNQGACGSCWTFSTTGNIEGIHAVATGDLISLSEQELVDCDKTDNGCNGGLMDNAFEAIEQLGGLEAEADYKYLGHRETCAYDESKVAVTISGYHDVPVGDEVAMQHQLLETGPLAIAINAMWMQFYRGGVSHPWKRLCSPKMLDHGVLIVGYGVEPANPDHVPFPKKEQPFWVIKNSWGPSWGEDGYYRIYRGDGTCGLDQYVTTAEV